MTELLAEPQTRLERLAVRLGCTEGQLYSMVIALTCATGLVLVSGVPLGDAPRAVAASPTPTATPVVVPTPTTTPPALSLGPLPLAPLATALPQQGEVPVVESPELPAPYQRWGPFDFRMPPPGAPAALTTDSASVYVGTDNAAGPASQLVVLSRTGAASRSLTVTGQPSARSGGLSAAAKRGADLLVTDRSRGALLQVNPSTGQQQVLAVLPDLPACLIGVAGTCQPGLEDRPPSPEGLAVAGGFAYITDAGQGTIWRYAFTTKQLVPWYSSRDFLSGSGPSGLARDAVGNLVFTVAETADLAALFKGALYRLAIDAEGAPGSRTLLATFDAAAAAGPVAVGRGGDTYVGLRGAGGVIVVRSNGTAAPLPGATASLLPSPRGLNLTDGALYVADAGRPATASSGRVRTVSVNDRPAS